MIMLIAPCYEEDAQEVLAHSLACMDLHAMSLEVCPICGYAVSTVTGKCRHCPPSPPIEANDQGYVLLVIASAAFICSLLFLGYSL